MITECITTTPDGTRHGVSRPAIKKFVDSKYHLEMNPLASSQLNRAIHHGADKGTFVLPKGPSGKVKLAPRRHTEAAKEVHHVATSCHFTLTKHSLGRTQSQLQNALLLPKKVISSKSRKLLKPQ
jgi:hypothetical protein